MDDKVWVGEFFLPEQYENRFPGEIAYSPTKGIILSCVMPGIEFPSNADIFHGLLEDGSLCSLIRGFFAKDKSTLHVKKGIQSIKGHAEFKYLAVGAHLNSKDTFSKIHFSLNHMQAFFDGLYQHGLTEQFPKKMFEFQSEHLDFHISIKRTFSLFGKEFFDTIYCNDINALMEFKCAFESIETNFPNSRFSKLKEVEYGATIDLPQPISLSNCYKNVINISNLFAILLYNPIFPESIQLSNVDEGFDLALYPCNKLSNRTLHLCKKDWKHRILPLNSTNVNIANLLESWFNQNLNYSTILSAIQNMTGFKDNHMIYGEFVLYASQIEWIANQIGAPNCKKYEIPIAKFGGGAIHHALSEVLGTEDIKNIGEKISTIRNNIVHLVITNPQKNKPSIPIQHVARLSTCLQLVIIGYFFSTLKIDTNLIEAYQRAIASSTHLFF